MGGRPGICYFKQIFKNMFMSFRERRERDRIILMWETNIDWLPPWSVPPRTEPTTQACALTRNPTPNFWSMGQHSNQLGHISQDLEFGFVFFKILFYLFLEREEWREKERERNISVWLPLASPLLGTWPATQACAWTGNQPAMLCFEGRCSIHWATPARAGICIFNTI